MTYQRLSDMNRYFNQSKLASMVILAMLVFSSSYSQAQEFKNGSYTHADSSKVIDVYGGTPLVVNLPASQPTNAQIKKASLYVRAHFGEDYTFGDLPFELAIDYTLTTQGGTPNTLCNNCEFRLNKRQPEAGFYLDITDLLKANGGITAFDIQSLNFTLTADALDVAIKNKILDALTISIDYQIDYQIDVAQNEITSTNTTVVAGSKQVEFAWGDSDYSPNYQLELLRLYNTDPSKNDSTKITADVDWNNAMSLNLESSKQLRTLTIAEGTGYYIWRVRAIGSLCEGGIANSCNYGTWSSEFNGEMVLDGPNTFPQDANNNQVAGFFYEEPDDQINYIYSRTFAEGGRVKETITYANGLQQVKQIQTRIPSDKTTVTAQTVYDFTGRPRVNTMPVPKKEDGLEGYKKKFTQNENGDLYDADDFDDAANGTVKTPNKIKQEGTDFSYYNGKDTKDKKEVPDAEGFPYTLSLYENDGTGRVKEQAGVGAKHSLEGGKTIRTFYEKASESELIRLFGDEAPNHNSVMKTITLDQNNVASVSYTSKEGQVIATCLIALDNDMDNLASLNDEVTAVMLEDKITGNYQNFNKIASSKRINLLEQKTLYFDYASECNGESNCEYKLTVLIKKLGNEPFGAVSEVSSGNVSWVLDKAATEGYIVSTATIISCGDQIKLNDISLPAGSYIVEKQLSPTTAFIENIAAEKSKIGEKTSPFVGMLASWIDEIVCSKDVEDFYARVDTLSAGLKGCFVGTGTSFGPPASLVGCEFTERDAEYYRNLDNYYIKHGLEWDQSIYQDFFNALHQVKLRRGFEIIIFTPECADLRVPLDFQDVIACSDVSMELSDKNKTYNDEGGEQYISVNPFMFLDNGLKSAGRDDLIRTEFSPDLEGYAYGFFWDCTPDESELVTEINKLILEHNADLTNNKLPASLSALRNLFENEFHIYMGDEDLLNASYIDNDLTVKSILGVSNLNHARNKLIFIYLNYLLPHMKGYEVPGTFNLMSHHMLTDSYTVDGFTINDLTDPEGKDRELVYNGPDTKINDCGDTVALADGSIVKKPTTLVGIDKVVSQQYYCEDLYNCWASQLGVIKATKANCPNSEIMEFRVGNVPYQLSNRIDDEDGDHDDVFDEGIKLNWVMRLFLGRKIKKISQKVRTMQVSPDTQATGEKDEDTPHLPIDPQYHLVNEFLNCTGYKFAKIVTKSDALPRSEDVVLNHIYSVPTGVQTYDLGNPNTSAWFPYSGKDRGYNPNAKWSEIFNKKTDGSLKEFNDPLETFKYIYDPVYAFKYFEYPHEVSVANDVDNGYRRLELLTCYKDYEVEDINICGYGYIECLLTKENWSGDQRFGFYHMLKAYHPFNDTTLYEARPKDFLSPGYIEVNENGDDEFVAWNGSFRNTNYQSLKQDNFIMNGKRMPTKVELDIERYNKEVVNACEKRRSELKDKLIEIFVQNCYVVVPCCEDTIATLYADTDPASETNNKVLEKDIDLLVDQLVRQCQERGQVRTFRLYEEGCKFTSNFSKGDFITTAEYGVAENELHTDKTVHFYYRTDLPTDPPNWIEDNTITLKYKDPITGEEKEVIDLSDADYTNYEDPLLTYCEWNRRREVMEMEMKVHVPNRCDGQPVGAKDPYDSACDPNDPLNPYKDPKKYVMDGDVKYPKTKRSPSVIRLKITIDKKNKATKEVNK